MASEDKNINKQPSMKQGLGTSNKILTQPTLRIEGHLAFAIKGINSPRAKATIFKTRSMEIATVVDSFQNILDGDAVLE